MGLKKVCLTVLCLIVFCFGIFYTFDRVNQGDKERGFPAEGQTLQ